MCLLKFFREHMVTWDQGWAKYICWLHWFVKFSHLVLHLFCITLPSSLPPSLSLTVCLSVSVLCSQGPSGAQGAKVGLTFAVDHYSLTLSSTRDLLAFVQDVQYRVLQQKHTSTSVLQERILLSQNTALWSIQLPLVMIFLLWMLQWSQVCSSPFLCIWKIYSIF